MQRKAVVRGEVHVSNMDRKALVNRELDSSEVLFTEGRSDSRSLNDYSVRYLLFLIGTLYFDMMYSAKNHIFRLFLPFWRFEITDKAREKGLEVETETDLELSEIYASMERKSINLSFGITVFALLYAFVAPLFFDHLQFAGWETPIPAWLFSVLIVSMFPILYSGLLITRGTQGNRDEYMAASIDSMTKENGYDGALILVGDSHVNPVSATLEELGWDVKRERSKHPLARISRLIRRDR